MQKAFAPAVWIKAGHFNGLLLSEAGDYLAKLQDNDIFRLRPFLAVHFTKTDRLSFRKGFKALALD